MRPHALNLEGAATDAQPDEQDSTGVADVKTITVPAGTNAVIGTVSGGAIRLSIDATDPVPGTRGLVFQVGDFYLPFPPRELRFTSETAITTSLNLVFLA